MNSARAIIIALAVLLGATSVCLGKGGADSDQDHDHGEDRGEGLLRRETMTFWVWA